MEIKQLMPLINAKIDQERAEEALGNQLTIAELLYELTKFDENLPVYWESGESPGDFSCYRGYYTDLAISDSAYTPTRKVFQSRLESVIGESYEGYKGGVFVMKPSTLVWHADGCGDCSELAVSGLRAVTGRLLLCTKVVELEEGEG